MTYEGINIFIAAMASALDCEYSYYPAENEDITRVPYILFAMNENRDFYADNINYAKKVTLAIEYDTRDRDIDGEKVIEALLEEAELTYTKSSAVINGQHIHEVMYEMEVILNAGE